MRWNICAGWSGTGRGDFRSSPLGMKLLDGSFIHHFAFIVLSFRKELWNFLSYQVLNAEDHMATSLILHLLDESNQTELTLIYTAFEQMDVITRRAVIKQQG